MKLLRRFAWPLGLTLVWAVFITWAYFVRPPFLELLELKAYDVRLEARGERKVSGQVTIVAVDEESLERVGRWPWSREITARLATALDAFAPVAVGYDISFSYPQPDPARQELVRLMQNAGKLGLAPTPEIREYMKQRLAVTSPDVVLARALANAKHPHILGYHFNLNPLSAERDAGAAHTLKRAARYAGLKQVDGGREAATPLPVGYLPKTNIELLAKYASSQAYFNVLPDMDGSIRRYCLAIEHDKGFYQPLAAAMFGYAVKSALPVLLVTENGVIGAQWGRHTVRTGPDGRMLVNYRGGSGTIPHVPAWKILDGTADAARLRGKYLMVGVTAPTVYDLRVTPVGVAYPGLEIHATVLDNMLTQDFIVRPGWAPLFDLFAIWGFAAATLLFLWRIRPLYSAPLFFGLSVLFIWFNQYFFEAKDFWLNIVYPLLAFVGVYLTLNVYRFVFADRQKKEIKGAFSKYLDPNVVQQVTENPERLSLGGEKLVLSVLFSDIRDFTSISEALTPDGLVKLLNRYLTEMTRIVMSNKGLLDKYIGDAVMAVYGAPMPYEEHAVMACRSALLMLERLDELNKAWEGEDVPRLAIGVGVNTGEIVAGNMGSEDRFDYTVMGDGVNLASRLEGLTKNYGVGAIISEFTQAKVGEHFWTRTLDLVRVKGKKEAVEIYHLQAPITEPQPLDYIPEYLEMVEGYRAGRFEEALALAETLARDHPEDKVLAIYASRLAELSADPPENWDGVYTYTTK